MAGIDPDRHRWAAWRPEDVYYRLADVGVPWYVASAWSIDLFLGAQHREHEDLEIATPAARFPEIADVLAELEFFVCRRDESIRLPEGEQVGRSAEGIPYARPELTLLFKAKYARPKDDDDLEAVLAVLEPDRRQYLFDLLATVHPGHRWLDKIASVEVRGNQCTRN
jgi:hypothetical protein